MIDKKQTWHEVLESIKVSVSSATFSTWFGQTHLFKLIKSDKKYLAEIGCPSFYAKSEIEKKYSGLVQDSLIKTLEKPCEVIFIIEHNPDKKTIKESASVPLFETPKPTEQDLTENLIKIGLRRNFTFDNFAVSSSNQMAHAAAEAVSRDLGTAYNPLFIWGGVGVGKSHLMNAIGCSTLEKSRDSKIFFCTGEQFTNDIVEGIRNKTTNKVRAKYRKLDALLIDDIQFIAGKDTVQEEFFHTFNSLVAAGAQIIMTSDRPPQEIAKLEERLRSRFEAGLIVDIAQPDFELRCAIVQIKSKEKGIVIPMDLIQLIAGNITSPRKIEGFLVKLTSETKFKKAKMSVELIESLLKIGFENNQLASKVTAKQVLASVSKYFSIGKRTLLGTSRKRPIARPRQILMYILRTQLDIPLQEVGKIVGGRDHTTVIHAVNKITHLASQDVQIREDIQGIKKLL